MWYCRAKLGEMWYCRAKLGEEPCSDRKAVAVELKLDRYIKSSQGRGGPVELKLDRYKLDRYINRASAEAKRSAAGGCRLKNSDGSTSSNSMTIGLPAPSRTRSTRP